jgi:mono/diheme cytochrome c family protein
VQRRLPVSLRESCCPAAACLGLFGCVSLAFGAANIPELLGLHDGRAIYDAACAACHGSHGQGTPTETAGFDKPETFPHFAKCDETTPEYTRDWKAVILKGGAARGFSHIMPSFSGALTSRQVDQVITYLRSLCTDDAWPLGELNVPRAIVTEKAFPESETILTSAINTRGPAGVSNELDYERVLGKRDQLDWALPFDWARQDSGASTAGVGDVTVGVKHVLFSHVDPPADGPFSDSTGSILSVQGEILLPTGSWQRGFGNGEPAFGLFAAYDRVLPAQSFLQFLGGVELPVRATHVQRSAYLRTAFGRSFSEGDEYGRQWTPMVEFTADRDLTGGASTDYDAVAEFQVTFNRRQHIRAALGYLVPLNDTAQRPRQVELYLLWDWFDGGLLEGW